MEGLLRTVDENGAGEARRTLRQLLKAHPGIPAWWAVLKEAEGRLSEEDPRRGLEELKRSVELSTRRAAERAARGLEGLKAIVTLSSSSVVEEAIRLASPPVVYVMESRPMREGAALVRRLMEGGIEARLVVDAAPGEIIREGKIEGAFVGADALFSDYLVNKVGTLPLAVLCRHFDRPFYAVVQWFKDMEMKFEEFYGKGSLKEPPGGLKEPHEVQSDLPALNFYFDLTPRELISEVFKG